MTYDDDLDPDAKAHSERLAALIRDQIASNGGALPFWRFMELALYAPGLGYYSAGATKLGEGGDFVTAPELGPLFAECVADALAPVLAGLGDDAVFMEIGGGTGAFAEAALERLAASHRLPARYAILEPSADLRQRQQARLRERLAPDVFARVEWLQSPVNNRWNGVVFANEVIDALPTSRFAVLDGEIYEEHVALDAAGGFVRQDRPADALLAAAVRHVERQCEHPFKNGYRSEVLPQLPYWVQAVVGGLEAGAMLFVDYGYPRREYYDPRRTDGTLRAFHRHRLADNVFARVGLQDVTVSVDFTALAEAGTSAGFEFAGYCSQASFLICNGLEQRLQDHEDRSSDEAARYALRQQAKKLTLPGEMGERFQAIGFARKSSLAHAFLAGDLSHRL
ncbi:class I SAM-dependent methyltransferase [Lysobacter hankyongensis]|uniref:SAM-dependent methyltransferase n=1 Tax=Lysobacter hankyongensis TaxID=1176535 RepID=A0ABP9C0S1_9GAMM